MTEFLTAAEIAGRLRISPRTVVDWANKGIIPCMRPSPKVLRFDPDVVAEALKTAQPSKNTATPQSGGVP